MAQSSQCYLPRFAPASDGPKRPVSIRTRPTPSQHAQLLTAWHEGRLESLLQATWALVLHYYIRSEDICFGYQHIQGGSSPSASSCSSCSTSRHRVQQSPAANVSAVRLSIDENDSIKAIVDRVRTSDGIDMRLGGSRSSMGASEGYLPYNTIVMLRTHCKATEMPWSPPSKPILATALPNEVRRIPDSCFILNTSSGDLANPESRRCSAKSVFM